MLTDDSRLPVCKVGKVGKQTTAVGLCQAMTKWFLHSGAHKSLPGQTSTTSFFGYIRSNYHPVKDMQCR